MKMKYRVPKDILQNEFKKYNWFVEENKGSISLQIKTNNDMIINWWESTGTISVVSNENDADMKILNKIINSGEISEEFIDTNNKIYIVHGHDLESKKDLELMLFNWGLKPIVSQDQANSGNFVLEGVQNDIKTCSYALVLLTPDDFGYSSKDGPEKLVPRARQNVIFELGFLMAIMPKKVAILKKAETNLPTDIQGLLYIAFGEKVDEIKEKIRKELLNAGIKISD